MCWPVLTLKVCRVALDAFTAAFAVSHHSHSVCSCMSSSSIKMQRGISPTSIKKQYPH